MISFNFLKKNKRPESSVMAAMAIDIAVNDKAQIWVLHDRNFHDVFGEHIAHLEYHPQTGDLMFVSENGMSRPLGMPVPERTRPEIEKAAQAHFFLIRDKKAIADCEIKPVRLGVNKT